MYPYVYINFLNKQLIFKLNFTDITLTLHYLYDYYIYIYTIILNNLILFGTKKLSKFILCWGEKKGVRVKALFYPEIPPVRMAHL